MMPFRVLLASPFLPFVVIFCRTVETRDPVHLEKLASVVEALRLAPTDRLPEAYSKQLRLFKLMYDVASKFVEANPGGMEGERGRTVSDADLEMLLTDPEFGLLQPAGSSSQQRAGQSFVDSPATRYPDDGRGGALRAGNQPDLGSWFDQNQFMTDFLGHDF